MINGNSGAIIITIVIIYSSNVIVVVVVVVVVVVAVVVTKFTEPMRPPRTGILIIINYLRSQFPR